MAPRKTAAAAAAASTSSVEAPPAPAPAPASPPPADVTEDVAAAVVATGDAPDLSSRIGQLALELASLIAKTKEVVTALKVAQRDVLKLQKQKDAGGRRRRGARASGVLSDGGSVTAGGAAPPRKPSGFAKPAKLSPQLCAFLDVAPDTELARMDVTRRITEYIKANNLNDSKDRRNIKPDPKLQAILAGPKDKPVTYFNLQAHIKHHFVKDAPAAASPPAATAVAVA